MRRRLLATLFLIAALYAGGWSLVIASGHGGNRVGGSHALWQLGGIMVYVAILAAPVWALVAVMTRAVRRLLKPLA